MQVIWMQYAHLLIELCQDCKLSSLFGCWGFHGGEVWRREGNFFCSSVMQVCSIIALFAIKQQCASSLGRWSLGESCCVSVASLVQCFAFELIGLVFLFLNIYLGFEHCNSPRLLNVLQRYKLALTCPRYFCIILSRMFSQVVVPCLNCRYCKCQWKEDDNK